MLKHSPIAHIPLLPVTIVFGSGIAIGTYAFSVWLIFAMVIFAAAMTIAKKYHATTLTLGLLLGIINAHLAIPAGPDTNLLDTQLTYRGTVTQIKESDTSQSAIITIEAYGCDSSTLIPCRHFDMPVIIPGFNPDINLTDKITFNATATIPSPRHDLPDELDPADFLLKEHMYLQAMVPTENIIGITPSSGLMPALTRIRLKMTGIIYSSSLSTATKEFLNTTLTGDSTDLGADTRELFSATGLSHILALSGLHVGLIAMVFAIMLWPLHTVVSSKWRTIVIVVLLWLYAAITGFPPSVTRAVIMATMLMFGRIIQRRTSSLNSLCFAALIILLFKPDALFSISFQLSFAAVLSILLFARTLNPVPPRKHRLHTAMSYFTVSISAILGTGLPATYYFHSFPLYFLISNIAVCLFLPFIIGGGLILLIAGACGLNTGWLCTLLDSIYNCIETISSYIASLPGAHITNVYIPAWHTIPYILALIALKLSLHIRKPRYYVMTAIGFATLLILFYVRHTPATPPTIYATRDTQHTDLVVYDGTASLKIWTSRPQEINAVKSRAEFRYRDFMGKRGIDSVTIMNQHTYNDVIVRFSKKSIALLHGKNTLDSAKLDYAIVCKGYTQRISDIMQKHMPDTIILSYDLHPKRAQRYRRECIESGLPYIWLRERQWSLSDVSSPNPRLK